MLSTEWKEIDHANAVWFIPTHKMKGKRPHAVPLVEPVMEILRRRSAEAEAGERYVFPAERPKSGHIVERAGTTSSWYRITKRAGLRSDDR